LTTFAFGLNFRPQQMHPNHIRNVLLSLALQESGDSQIS